ncbi:hypothetical protein [Streptomyces humi]
MSKICKQCEESKPLAEFSRHPRAKDGLTKTCTACLSAAGKARYAARRSQVLPVREEARSVPFGALRGVRGLSETMDQEGYDRVFEEMTYGQGIVYVPDLPWPFAGDYGLTDEQLGAIDGMMIALLRGDSLDSKYLLNQVARTFQEALAVLSHMMELLVGFAIPDSEKERVIEVCQRIINKRTL